MKKSSGKRTPSAMDIDSSGHTDQDDCELLDLSTGQQNAAIVFQPDEDINATRALQEEDEETTDLIEMMKNIKLCMSSLKITSSELPPPQARKLNVDEMNIGTTLFSGKRQQNVDDDSTSEDRDFIAIEPEVQLEKVEYPVSINENNMQIGPNGTIISAAAFQKIDWASTLGATRGLLTVVFDEQTLATHSLAGTAFNGQKRPLNECLNSKMVDDIIKCVTSILPKVEPHDIISTIASLCATAASEKAVSLKKIKLELDSELEKTMQSPKIVPRFIK